MNHTFEFLYTIFYGCGPRSKTAYDLCKKYGLDTPPLKISEHTIEFGKLINDPNYKHGKLIRHRLDGPAVIRKSGDTIWFINGRFIQHLIGEWAKENDIDLNNLTEVDKALIKITWADYGK